MSRRAHQSQLARAAGLQSEVLAAVQRRVGVTPTGLAVVLLALVGFVAGRMIASRAMFLMVYGALALVVIARFLNRRRLAVDVRRSRLPVRVRQGQRVSVEIELVAQRRVSTVLVEEMLHPQLGASMRLPISTLPPGATVHQAYTFMPRLRGVYQVGPLRASWSDPFGLNEQSTVLAEPVEIIVHPATEELHDRVVTREWEDPPIRPPSSKPWPTGFEFYGMRDYVSGDDPRRIVWRAAARTIDPDTGLGRYFVRESEQGITDRVNLVLDTSRSRHSSGTPSETLETAVRVVASLGVRHLRDGFSVSFETNSAPVVSQLHGRRSQTELLDHLARVDREDEPFSTAVDRLLVGRRRAVHNVLVTPHLDHEAASRLGLLSQRGVPLLVVLVQSDDPDADSIRRAGAIGCSIVEVTPGMPLERVFQHLVAGGRQ